MNTSTNAYPRIINSRDRRFLTALATLTVTAVSELTALIWLVYR